MGRSRKPLSLYGLRGFESPSLRHYYYIDTTHGGDVAQLGEHLVRNEGAGGSSPLISTIFFVLWDRARWGVSGALFPQSAIAGSNSLRRASGVDVFRYGSGVDDQVPRNGHP